MSEIDLNPDRPHSPERTAEAGTFFDALSRLITYATMPGRGGIEFPADVYVLVAELYSATGRLPQICEQMDTFLRQQEATGRLYEARSLDVAGQVSKASAHLAQAAGAAEALTRALQAVQADIAGLGVTKDPDA